MIAIEERHKKIISTILVKYPYKFYIFGSRATGKAKRFSDLDLCFTENIPANIISAIEEDFEESDLPYLVDIIDFTNCDISFKRAIEKDMIPIT